jgi:NAD(P)-dependent dehydrogenase (short-subunit alcohol dehydrogenase family)
MGAQTMTASGASRPPVVLITGASSGIGKACAEFLFARGCRVYGTSRHAPRAVVEARTSDLAPLLRMVPLDVTSDESVAAAIGVVLASEGRIDVVVNNAGFGVAGAVEWTTMDEAHAQFETNFFGTMRVCRAVLPVMRQQGSGRILNISSIAGQIGIPFQALYSASKFAIEGLTEALRMEVAAFGIQVVLIEPGDFRTGFTAARRMAHGAVGQGFSLAETQAAVGQGFSLAETQGNPEGSPYLQRQAKALAVMEHDESHGATPEVVGRLVYRIIMSRSPGVRYAVGPVSEKLALILKRLLPSRLLAWGIGKYYKVG